MCPSVEPDLEGLGERIGSLLPVARLREVAHPPIYLVGGTVRDLLLGAERVDLDVAVEGELGPVVEHLGGVVRAHERFETATAELEGIRIDLARARRETYAKPGALPEVEPATLAEDLARRDFTVNAMAVPLQGEQELIDPHGGLADLAAGQLRVLHAGSFVDDPTRALRAARYAARLGFGLESGTAELAHAADLGTVSEDRVEAELLRLAAEEDPRRGFELLDRWGLHELPDGAGETIDTVGDLLAQPPWSDLADRALAVLAAARGANGEVTRLAEANPARASEAVALAGGHDGETLALARARGGAWLDRYVGKWRDVRLEITGEDLIAAGVSEGPAVGRGLDKALAGKLDGELNGRDEELGAALEAARD
jgi:tRNA nucleotidyltransferase (CCA-adding enzyme)